MKPVEDAFTSGLFRRVILPGTIVTLGVHPVLAPLLAATAHVYGLDHEGAVILVAEVIFWGLVLSSAIQPIYYLFEGFHLPWLARLMRPGNERRLARLETRLARFDPRTYDQLSPAEQDRYAVTYEAIHDYPLRVRAGRTERYVDRSTRLGNIISTYELYAETRYDVNGVFFWDHLLAFAPAGTVAEFQENYQFAESLVLTSFAGTIVIVVNVVALIALGIGTVVPPAAVAASPLHAWQFVLLIAFGVLAFAVFYRFALAAHRDAGRIFRAAVDLAIPQFNDWAKKVRAEFDNDVSDDVHAWLDRLSEPAPDPEPARAGMRDLVVGALSLVLRLFGRRR